MANAVYENGGGNVPVPSVRRATDGRAICPACHGLCYQEITVTTGVFSALASRVILKTETRQRPCLSCCDHPGQVEAYRICPACGKFTDACQCERHKNTFVRQMEIVMSENKTPGVAWDEKNQAWQTYVPKDGKQVYLGLFKDKDLAEGIVMEARQLPADQIPAL